jgi:hypothetical protein
MLMIFNIPAVCRLRIDLPGWVTTGTPIAKASSVVFPPDH